MQTKPKSNSVVTHERLTDRPVIVFRVKDVGEFEFDMDKVSDDVMTRFEYHGAIQRISDAAAIGRDTATGKSAPPAARFENMKRLADHYMTGTDDWSLPTRGGVFSKKGALDRLPLAAVCEALNRDEASIRALIAEGSSKHSIAPDAYLATLTTAAVVRPIYERMKAEQASALAKAVTFDPDAELDEATGS